MARIIIVDDFNISALGIKALLDNSDGNQIVGIFTDSIEALDFAKNEDVDLILCDIEMPRLNGFEFLSLIKSYKPDIKVIMLTISEDRDSILKAIALEADGYIFKDTNREELLKSLNIAYNDQFACNLKLMDIIIQDIQEIAREKVGIKKDKDSDREKDGRRTSASEIPNSLTAREFEILKLIGMGYSTKDISAYFSISPYTVSTHRKNIYAKLGIEQLSSLVRIAKETVNNEKLGKYDKIN